MACTERYLVFTAFVMLTLTSIPLCHSEIFTALVELQKVLVAEDTLSQDLRSYIAEEEHRLAQLKDIADDYEAHSADALVNPESFLANPLNGFLLVKRFTIGWDRVEALIRNNTSEIFLGRIQNTLQTFPDQEDLTGAATALLRLQDTYALSTDKLARGEIQGVSKSPVLSAGDCFELGRISYNGGDYYHTILWMQQALHRLEEQSDTSVDKALLLDYLAFAVYSQGNIQAAMNLTYNWLEIEPDHVRAQNNIKYYKQMLEEEEAARRKGDDGVAPEPVTFQNERQLDDYRASYEFQTYEALCRNEDPVPDPTAHLLTCQYRFPHPYFRLRPLKEETMFLKPWIVIYHNLLTDSEVARIKEIAAPRLHRSGVFTYNENDNSHSKYRTSKSAWLRDDESHLIARVSQRIKKASGLSLDTAEELQVVNYGIGGHYEPHFDFARKEEHTSFKPLAGNRIATAIFYMSDVEAGGATVFPQIGVKLWPEKGALAFWYNLLRNGEGDYMTRHAACPVLTGSKWVCNKWIHERSQEFRRPCALDPEI